MLSYEDVFRRMVDSGLSLEQIRFRYAITGDGLSSKPLPPLFVIGPQCDGQLVNYRFRSPYYVVGRLFGAAELRLGRFKGGKAEVGRIERSDSLAPAQAPARGSGVRSEADAQPVVPPAKADPETLALRAQPRSVVRLNRRMLAAGAGTLTAAVLGGTLWSLQSQQRARNPATELFNVDRIAKSAGLERLPKDYAGLPPALKAPPMLG